MPFPVQVIGPKPPSPLAFFAQGLAGAQQQAQQSRVLGDIFGGQQAQMNPSERLRQILTTPMDPDTRQLALQNLQFETNLRSAERQMEQIKVTPQMQANILREIPADSDPRDVFIQLMQKGVPSEQAVKLASEFKKQQAKQPDPRQRAQDVRTQWNDLIQDVQDKSKGALGGTAFRAGSIDRRVLDAQIRRMRQMQQQDMQDAAKNPDAQLRLNNIQNIKAELDQIETGIRGLQEAAKEAKEGPSLFDRIFGTTKEKEVRKLNLANPTDVEIGQQILLEAGGDIEVAKKIARERGFTFD